MKRPDLVKCVAIIVAGVVAVAGIIVEPANSILAIGLFAIIAFICSM